MTQLRGDVEQLKRQNDQYEIQVRSLQDEQQKQSQLKQQDDETIEYLNKKIEELTHTIDNQNSAIS